MKQEEILLKLVDIINKHGEDSPELQAELAKYEYDPEIVDLVKVASERIDHE